MYTSPTLSVLKNYPILARFLTEMSVLPHQETSYNNILFNLYGGDT